ncbi:MAG: SMP-30/gluconolactonase/LRE family protein [Anaerolineales bacterium]
MANIELLLDAHASLGEGPAWDDHDGLLYWVDILAGRVHRYNPWDKTDHMIDVGEMVGCLAPAQPGRLILGVKSGFAMLDLATETLTHLHHPEPHLPGNRFNDGKCDPAGRFLAGTMDMAEKDPSGALYTYAPNGALKTLVRGVRISNGLAWSPDYRTLYYIDTPTRVVMAYDYDLATGDIANPRVAVTVPQEMGWPDGMTSDAQGMLWVALWGGAAVTRWDPHTGSLLGRYPIPARQVTSCVFGGENLDVLYVTTARVGLGTSNLTAYPHSGGLFRLRVGVTGMPTFRFGG